MGWITSITHPTGLANRNMDLDSHLPHDTERGRDMHVLTIALIIFHAAVCMGSRSGQNQLTYLKIYLI